MGNLEIKLEQHTPIIQFQGEQKGAFLRGTEIKPKLDKFLIKYEFKNDFEKYGRHLIGYKTGMQEEDFKDKKAFNYKIRVKTSGIKYGEMKEKESNGKISKTTYFYFNNIGKAAKADSNRLVNSEEITVEFFSLDNDLLKAIDDNFKDFLLINNFGFRQNKTFGSFTAVDDERSDEEIIKKIKELKDNKNIYYAKYKKNILPKQIRDDAEKIYQYMKSGIALKNCKSYLFDYMRNKGIMNEKQFIINKFFTNKNKKSRTDNANYKYVRAVLGISNSNNFKGTKIDFESDIERYKSPILFKIINNMLIIIPEEENTLDNIYDKEFELKKGEKIKTPTKEEFNLEDFLTSFVNDLNSSDFKKIHKLKFEGKIEVK